MLHQGTPSSPNQAPNGVRFEPGGSSAVPSQRRASARPAARRRCLTAAGLRPRPRERRAGARADDAVGLEAGGSLERPHGALGRGAVGAVERAGVEAERGEPPLDGEHVRARRSGLVTSSSRRAMAAVCQNCCQKTTRRACASAPGSGSRRPRAPSAGRTRPAPRREASSRQPGCLPRSCRGGRRRRALAVTEPRRRLPARAPRARR